MRPRLLDLFCGAGGAAMGYHRAGFDVAGVDINPQPNYPFEFVRADAMTYPLDGYDAIHASPPCHDHSNVTGRNRKASGVKGTGWMLAVTLERLATTGLPFVVENVRRHRWFASNLAMLQPACAHHLQAPRFRSLDSSRKPGSLATVVGVHGHLNYAGEGELRQRAMGIDWMTVDELSQAIPPAYTHYIGEQMLDHLAADRTEVAGP